VRPAQEIKVFLLLFLQKKKSLFSWLNFAQRRLANP
jgi:hypothetical protein